jgi:excisionase family DNA binding protein
MPDTEITPTEAARLLGVSRATLQRYANAGRLHPRRLPSGYRRYDLAEVKALLTSTMPNQEASETSH